MIDLFVTEFLKKKLYLMDKAMYLNCIPKLLAWGLQVIKAKP
jgi:hypothetical protein